MRMGISMLQHEITGKQSKTLPKKQKREQPIDNQENTACRNIS